jgi:alkylated DNA repair dioxygenase AlkB
MHPHVSRGEQKIPAAEVKRWVLGNGSLVVMQGETQENWKVRSVSIPDGFIVTYCTPIA